MAREECIVCEAHFPDGEGLEDGRCPACAADYAERQPAKPKKGKAGGDGKQEE